MCVDPSRSCSKQWMLTVHWFCHLRVVCLCIQSWVSGTTGEKLDAPHPLPGAEKLLTKQVFTTWINECDNEFMALYSSLFSSIAVSFLSLSSFSLIGVWETRHPQIGLSPRSALQDRVQWNDGLRVQGIDACFLRGHVPRASSSFLLFHSPSWSMKATTFPSERRDRLFAISAPPPNPVGNVSPPHCYVLGNKPIPKQAVTTPLVNSLSRLFGGSSVLRP